MDRAKADSANGSVNGIVRLFLLVGNRLLRDTLLRLFRKPADISIVGQGAPTVTTSSEVGSSQCDVVLTDSFTPNVPVVDPLFKDTAKTFSAEILLVGMDNDEEEFYAGVGTVWTE
jgi:hypothetical protein